MKLKQHANDLLRILSRSEVTIAADTFTDNLVVHDGTRGFVITHHCLDDWGMDRIVTEARKAVDDLLLGAPWSGDVKFYTVEEMNLQRVQPRAFDARVGHE